MSRINTAPRAQEPFGSGSGRARFRDWDPGGSHRHSAGERQSVFAQADPSWTGKRVVRKAGEVVLRPEDKAAKPIKSFFYRVERIKGSLLRLKADQNARRGWAPAEQVVLVDEAIEFFTKRLRSNPQDAFSYLMRGTVWADKEPRDRGTRKSQGRFRTGGAPRSTVSGRIREISEVNRLEDSSTRRPATREARPAPARRRHR